MKKIKIELLKHQAEFVTSGFRNTGLIGGLGSGKTQAGVVKTIIKKLANPMYNVAYYLPTNFLIKTIALPRFEEILLAMGLNYKVNRQDYFIQVSNGSDYIGDIILRTMERPEFITGYETAYSLIDEADTINKETMEDIYKKILRRNRANPNGDNQVDFVGTPEGFLFLYDFFDKNKKPYKRLVRARTYDNPYLPPDYIDNLKDEHSEIELRAYLNGEFVNFKTDAVFSAFDDRRNISNRTLTDNDRSIIVGMDFNIGKMAAVIYIRENSKLTAVEEIINAFDTYDMANILRERYRGRSVIIYPDASAKNRKTSSAGVTDLQILKSAGFVVKSYKANPLIRDRVNETNKQLRKGNLLINKDTCPVYYEAMKNIGWYNGTIDKRSGLDHIIDAGTYPVYWINKNISYSI